MHGKTAKRRKKTVKRFRNTEKSDRKIVKRHRRSKTVNGVETHKERRRLRKTVQ